MRILEKRKSDNRSSVGVSVGASWMVCFILDDPQVNDTDEAGGIFAPELVLISSSP